MDLAGIGSIMGGLGGLFGGKGDKNATERHMRQAMNTARKYAPEYGFNPLTALGIAGGNPFSGGGGGTPPLASVEMLLGGLDEVSTLFAGPQAQAKAQRDFMNDKAALGAQTHMRGLYARPSSVVPSIGGPSPLGGSTASYYPMSGWAYGDQSGNAEERPPVVDKVQSSAVPAGVLPAGGAFVDYPLERGAAGENLNVPAVPDPQIVGGHDFKLFGIPFESPPNTTSPAVMEELGGEPVGWAWSIPWSIDSLQHNLRRAPDRLSVDPPEGYARDGGVLETKPKTVSKKKTPMTVPRSMRSFDPFHRDGYRWAF